MEKKSFYLNTVDVKKIKEKYPDLYNENIKIVDYKKIVFKQD